MRARCLIAVALIFACFAPQLGFGSETSTSRKWNLMQDIPFSFVYGGRKSGELLPTWKVRSQTKKLDANRTQQTTTRVDPTTGLEVRCVAIEYSDFPAIEWTVYLKNTGKKDTPIIENLQGLDSNFERGSQEEFLLHHNVGSPGNGDDYSPLQTPLPPNASKRISAAGGRATNSDLSYFNLAWGNQGTIIVVGWPGQWAADFVRDTGTRLHVTAGQELTHFKLHPGEEMRTPLIVLLNWQGDWIHGQNLWRHWMMAHGMPKPGGKLPSPLLLGYTGRAYGEMINADEGNQIMSIDRYLQEGLNLDYWWMDAGWYVQTEGWPQVGTWEVDKKRFPNGFKPISDHAHAHGMKTLVWFEPERVAPRTWLADNHPEWLLSPMGGLVALRSSQLGGGEPCVFFNPTEHQIAWSGIHWEPHSVAFHPGPKGEYSVVRFTAPMSGEFRVSASFAGIDEQTTTDVHIQQSGRSLFDSFIRLNGQGRRAAADRTVSLNAGQTLDFVVGYGNGSYTYDSTGLVAVVTGPDGKPHDAAKEFGTGHWTYGYLAPGSAPDSATFRPFDRNEKVAGNGNSLLDLGNPTAWKWLVEHVDKLLIDNGIDLYRQDFNMNPLSYWRANDAPDRQGITENKHILGYLAYWDELRRRHPSMLIDSCASGGRRNDLETMRRAVPLWRSDYAYEPLGHQSMTYGISMWLPYYGTGTVADEDAPYYGSGVTPVHPYAFWSNACPSLMFSLDIREKGIDYATLRRLVGDWKSIGPYFYGDYYPLTPCNRRDDNWIAWQFDRPDKGDGIVQAFRRPKALEEIVSLQLHGLDPKAAYRVTVIDGAEPIDGRAWTGQELMGPGLPITLKQHPAAAVIKYVRIAN